MRCSLAEQYAAPFDYSKAEQAVRPHVTFAVRVFVAICIVGVIYLLWVLVNLLAEPKRRRQRRR